MMQPQVSDFMYTVPNVPHLRGIQIEAAYKELLEPDAPVAGSGYKAKWKQDPDAARYHGFAPRHKYFINGVMTGEQIATPYETSKSPFPERRVPRRGLVQVYPDDPDYVRICLEQGLEELVKDRTSPSLANGIHSASNSHASDGAVKPLANGTNGHFGPELGNEGAETNGGHVNGINGTD